MIGIFDSGSGGLTFLAAMYSRCPQYTYLYLGDHDNCPYGAKTPEEIQNLTIIGVKKLFDSGASIVILACNTASAWTLRILQTQIFPDRIILGVTIPGAEKVVQLGLHSVTVFATQQTVNSKTYGERVGILDATITIEEIALSGSMVLEIENLLPVRRCKNMEEFMKIINLYHDHQWNCISADWQGIIDKYFAHYCLNNAILLGCTHYPYLKKLLQRKFAHSTFIDPSEESALSLIDYIKRHNVKLLKESGIIFL